MEELNPFLISNYTAPEFFCDREEETTRIIQNITGNSNIVFFAQRRIGKTALVRHVFHELERKKNVCIYIDIFATKDLKDFSDLIAGSIYKIIQQRGNAFKKFWESIKLMRPVLTTHEMTGQPELTLDITTPRQVEKSITQMFEYLDSQRFKVVIAIDEFQQILNYPEKNVEALLRTCIQQLKNVNFIFCGSNLTMMHQIFTHTRRPFYSSTMNLNLKRIPRDKYMAFIRHHFEKGKRKITDDVINEILDLTDSHTYYTQRLCHELYGSRNRKLTIEAVRMKLGEILTDHENMYFQYRNLITSVQFSLMRAVAIEGRVYQPYSQLFIKTHNLGGVAGVKRALNALVEKELVFYHSNIEKPFYEIQDKFLMHWLRVRF